MVFNADNEINDLFLVKDLVHAINDCKHLCFLDLEGNTLGCEAAKHIGEALKKHPEFKRALWKDMFTGRMKTEIPPALIDLSQGVMLANARLTVLDLSDNALGPNGMSGLVDLIKSPSCFSLQELRLMNCGLGITGAKMLAKSLTHCYNKSVEAGTPMELRVFAAGRNRLENEGAKALSAIFGEIQTLQEIIIPQNGIYHPGMSALAEALKKNVNMQVINFNDNTITAKGAEPLAEAFYAIEALREINLGDCLLKDEGGQILTDVLADCHPDLEYLNLSGNEIGPEVGMAIANAMGHKDSLRELILDCNQFGEEGVEAIQQIMEDYGKLDIISVEDDEGEADDDGEEDGELNPVQSYSITSSSTFQMMIKMMSRPKRKKLNRAKKVTVSLQTHQPISVRATSKHHWITAYCSTPASPMKILSLLFTTTIFLPSTHSISSRTMTS